jgi:hypothetical protein
MSTIRARRDATAAASTSFSEPLETHGLETISTSAPSSPASPASAAVAAAAAAAAAASSASAASLYAASCALHAASVTATRMLLP